MAGRASSSDEPASFGVSDEPASLGLEPLLFRLNGSTDGVGGRLHLSGELGDPVVGPGKREPVGLGPQLGIESSDRFAGRGVFLRSIDLAFGGHGLDSRSGGVYGRRGGLRAGADKRDETRDDENGGAGLPDGLHPHMIAHSLASGRNSRPTTVTVAPTSSTSEQVNRLGRDRTSWNAQSGHAAGLIGCGLRRPSELLGLRFSLTRNFVRGGTEDLSRPSAAGARLQCTARRRRDPSPSVLRVPAIGAQSHAQEALLQYKYRVEYGFLGTPGHPPNLAGRRTATVVFT